ncbi:MAG TPA: phospholipase [Phycicoccus sp.]|nr:phospholipase [Phycicoccus sp.]
MDLAQWFLTAKESDNAATTIDARLPDGVAWTVGNHCRAIVHGRPYFAELFERIGELEAGDRLYFADWRGDPDELLTDDPESTVSATLTAAARRGVDVRGLLWRSHWRHFGFHADKARFLGEEIGEAGGQCLRDMRVRTGGAHHQKFVVLRHQGRPERDIAYVGGIDLCHSRRDDATHAGDRQTLPMSAAYGPTLAWHDVHLALTGPAVYDVETTFRERWEDTTPLSMHPGRSLASFLQNEDLTPEPLGEQWPPPPPCRTPPGGAAVQVVRTYPKIQPRAYDFAPDGERSIVLANTKAVAQARRLIYVEDQFFWGEQVGAHFATVLRDQPELRLIVVLPLAPDLEGYVGEKSTFHARRVAMEPVLEAGGDRVAFFGLSNQAGLPIYVHSKVCVIDDVWASVGSDNLNRRSWTSDSELAALILPGGSDPGAETFARGLRRTLVAEHLGCPEEEVPDDPAALLDAMRSSAAALDDWYAAGGPAARSGLSALPGRVAVRTRRRGGARVARARLREAREAGRRLDRAAALGARPPGQLRLLPLPDLTPWENVVGRIMYPVIDPDGTLGRDEDLQELSAPNGAQH